jgi:hypothetical protein
VRHAKWYASFSLKERQALLKGVAPLVLSRKGRLCNFVEYKGKTLAVSLGRKANTDAGEHEEIVSAGGR